MPVMVVAVSAVVALVGAKLWTSRPRPVALKLSIDDALRAAARPDTQWTRRGGSNAGH